MQSSLHGGRLSHRLQYTCELSASPKSIDFDYDSPWNDTGTISQANEQQFKMTNIFMESLKSVSPGSGAYLNEVSR